MKKADYINLCVGKTQAFIQDVIFPEHANAYWTSNGESYRPCILLDDEPINDFVTIVTRGRGFTHHPSKNVIMMENVEVS